jgi:hypothetical protein
VAVVTELEERLRAALRSEADRRRVDTAALDRQVQGRLSQRPRRRAGLLGRTALPLVAAAAAAAAVAGTVGVVDRLRPEEPRSAAQVAGGVADSFTCPSRGRTVFDADNDDDSFLPLLTDDLEPAGEASSLPRYEVQRRGDLVRARFGNADGTLASVVVFRSAGDGYEPATITKCTNGPGPRGPDLEPGTLPPATDRDHFTPEDFSSGAVQLMETLTYDVNGLRLRSSVWAEPCGATLCLVAGKSTSYARGRVPAADAAPSDATDFLYDADTIVGQRTGYRLIVSLDRDNALRAVSWETRAGESTEVEPVTGGWSGQLFAMVVPRDELAVVTLHPRQGPPQVFRADEIRR